MQYPARKAPQKPKTCSGCLLCAGARKTVGRRAPQAARSIWPGLSFSRLSAS